MPFSSATRLIYLGDRTHFFWAIGNHKFFSRNHYQKKGVKPPPGTLGYFLLVRIVVRELCLEVRMRIQSSVLVHLGFGKARVLRSGNSGG